MPKVGVERNIVEKYVQEALDTIKKDKRIINHLKTELIENGIKAGDVQYIVLGRTPLKELDMKLLCLLTIKLSKYTRMEVSPQALFTDQEIKDASSMQIINEQRISLPYTFENVTYVKEGNYSTIISAQQIKELWDSNLLKYNFETQREARIEKSKDDEIIFKPKTVQKSVNEIAELLKSGDLETTTITFNARVNTADAGEELVYDHKNRTLTVTKGTIIDILDGYHRISGIIKAFSEDNTLNAVFDLKILNYSTNKAIKYFNQINTTNPISHSRLKETNLGNLATVALEELKDKCEFLMGKISSGDQIYSSANQLVSAKVIIDAIDDHYNPSDRIEAKEVGFYLAKFFDTLFISYPDAFVRNPNEIRKTSLINANMMFDGYVLLSKLFKEKNIPLNKLNNVIDNIDFNRNNPLWKEVNVIDENGVIVTNPKKGIRQVFSNLNIEEVLANV